ncbi:hypothetical protein LP416_12565 [Polaromonas sp. P2-4]|nr:hypothetical protein LP416_12565 [Polaromonas sp. P2-4]
MNQIDQIGSYLSGESFSDDLPFRPQIISHPQSRGDVLTQWVAGRRVLHVGFADHVQLIASRVADGSWLHARLTRSASVCRGIDISPQAVATAGAWALRTCMNLTFLRLMPQSCWRSGDWI